MKTLEIFSKIKKVSNLDMFVDQTIFMYNTALKTMSGDFPSIKFLDEFIYYIFIENLDKPIKTDLMFLSKLLEYILNYYSIFGERTLYYYNPYSIIFSYYKDIGSSVFIIIFEVYEKLKLINSGEGKQFTNYVTSNQLNIVDIIKVARDKYGLNFTSNLMLFFIYVMYFAIPVPEFMFDRSGLLNISPSVECGLSVKYPIIFAIEFLQILILNNILTDYDIPFVLESFQRIGADTCFENLDIEFYKCDVQDFTILDNPLFEVVSECKVDIEVDDNIVYNSRVQWEKLYQDDKVKIGIWKFYGISNIT